jgi:2'-5' RNA ligase
MKQLAPFEVTLGEVEIFETTRVIYLSIERGWRQIEEFHSVLSEGILWYEEYYPFHPHMTVGQEIPGPEFEQTLETAREVWRNCPYSRTFRVEHLTFVQNVDPNCWDTVSEHSLLSHPTNATLLETK